MVNRPHPLFVAVAAAVLAGVITGWTAEARSPIWALRSEWLYRIEVATAVFGLIYLVLVALTLAWRGRTFRRVQAPGGAGIEAPADEIETAADKITAYKEQADRRFEKVESTVDDLNRRVEQLEADHSEGTSDN